MKPIYAKPKKIPTIPLSLPVEASTTVHNHLTGDAFFKNQIATVSPQYDADVKTGRALALGATNDLPIPAHVDGYITYHNLDTDTITQEATDGTDKVFNTITINNILTHQMAFSAGDLTLIQQEPNLIAALAMGEVTPISSVTLDADDSWYACSEVSGADVFDARVAGNDTTISGDLTNVRITNQQKGLQTTALLLDGAGVPESYNNTPNTARVYDDTIISTGFKPSIAEYSIEEESSGLMQDFGSELFTNNLFDTDTDWTKGDGWTISDGTANCDGTQAANSLLTQAPAIVEGNNYLVSFDIINSTEAGDIVVSVGGNISSQVTTNGSYQIAVVAGAFPNSGVRATSTFVGSIDNLYMKELTTKTQRTEKRLLTHTSAKLGLGNADVTSWLPQASGIGNTITDTGTIGEYNILQITESVNNYTPRIIFYNSGYTSGEWIAEITVAVSSGTIHLHTLNVDGGTNISIAEDISAGETKTFTARFSVWSGGNAFQFDGSLNATCEAVATVVIREISTESKYYIGTDGGAMVEQDVTPPLPDPNTTINLGNTAVIGYADTITERSADFDVHSEAIVP